MPGSYELLSRCFYPVGVWSLVMVVFNLLATGLLKWARISSGIRQQRLAGYLGIYPFYILQVYYSHIGTWEIYNGGLDRTSDSSPGCDTFSFLYIASNLVAAIGQLQTEQGTLLVQLMVHHVISIVAFASAWYHDRLRFWSTLAGLCEVTNLFLVPVFAAKEIPVIKTRVWYKCSSICLYISFIVYRGALFPAWLWLWYSEARPSDLSLLEQTYPLVILSLLVLSSFWFRLIHYGNVKLWTPGYYDENGLHNGQMPLKAE